MLNQAVLHDFTVIMLIGFILVTSVILLQFYTSSLHIFTIKVMLYNFI